jgi:hypothetical protein
LADLKAFTHLAGYYADKLRGATELYLFRVSGDSPAQARAIQHLQNAVEHWRAYGQVAASLYETQLLARMNTTDWHGTLLDLAIADIDIARNAQQADFPESVIHSNLPASMR